MNKGDLIEIALKKDVTDEVNYLENQVNIKINEHLADNASHKLIVNGEYTGDGGTVREIILGFKANIIVMYLINVTDNGSYPKTMFIRHGDYGYCLTMSSSSPSARAGWDDSPNAAPLITANGFKVGWSGNDKDTNKSGGKYVYMAIR